MGARAGERDSNFPCASRARFFFSFLLIFFLFAVVSGQDLFFFFIFPSFLFLKNKNPIRYVFFLHLIHRVVGHVLRMTPFDF